MARLITASERMVKARELIQQARDVPRPTEHGRFDLSYVAQVKDILTQARDLIKFISYSPSANQDVKAEVKQIFKEIDQAEMDILHK